MEPITTFLTERQFRDGIRGWAEDRLDEIKINGSKVSLDEFKLFLTGKKLMPSPCGPRLTSIERIKLV